MFAGSFHSLFWTYLVVISCSQISASVDKEKITIQSGQNVILKCRAPNNNIAAVEWRRADPDKDKYVLLYRNKKFDLTNQHPTFKDRVDLRETPIRDGDVSLILNNVTINDAGTYECHVLQRNPSRKKRSALGTEPIKFIDLSVVVPPGHTGGSAGLKVGLSLPAVLLLAAVVF